MFKDQLTAKAKNEIKCLQEHSDFLSNIIDSLRDTYYGHITSDRRSNLENSIIFHKKPDDKRLTYGAIKFKVTDKGVRFICYLHYQDMERYLGLKEYTGQQIERAKESGKKLKVAYDFPCKYYPVSLIGKKLPKYVDLEIHVNNSCGNGYNLEMNLKKDEKNLSTKLKLIIKVMKAKGFHLRYSVGA